MTCCEFDTVDILNEKYGGLHFKTIRIFYSGFEIIGFADYFTINDKLYF